MLFLQKMQSCRNNTQFIKKGLTIYAVLGTIKSGKRHYGNFCCYNFVVLLKRKEDCTIQEEYQPDLVSLSDDEGNEYNFEVLDSYDENDTRYVAMTPYAEEGEQLDEEMDGSLVIMKVVEENGENYFVEIEDDDEYERVANEFVTRLQDYYEIDEQ